MLKAGGSGVVQGSNQIGNKQFSWFEMTFGSFPSGVTNCDDAGLNKIIVAIRRVWSQFLCTKGSEKLTKMMCFKTILRGSKGSSPKPWRRGGDTDFSPKKGKASGLIT